MLPRAAEPGSGLHLENSVNRNRIKHTNEIVSQYMHWLDDEVFTECPTWGKCEQAGKIPRLDLERYFGKADENGPGNYAQSAKYGVGRRVLCNILEGTESEDSIAEALNTLPPTDRRPSPGRSGPPCRPD